MTDSTERSVREEFAGAMTRKNPFRIIRITAATVGTIALFVIFGFISWSGMSRGINKYGPEVLWQVPLVILIFVGIFALMSLICSVIANVWTKAERRWDRKP